MISNLVLNASMKLAGEYLDNTTLMALPGTTGPMITDRGDAAKVSLQDLTVHGGDVPTVSRTMVAAGFGLLCSGTASCSLLRTQPLRNHGIMESRVLAR